MEKLSNVLDNFVYLLKKSDDFLSAKFIHSGRKEYTQRVEDDFLVACAVSSSKVSFTGENPSAFEGLLEFCVYAPSDKGKRELTMFCESIVRTLYESENSALIQDMNVEEAAFDKDLVVWRQSVLVRVDLSGFMEQKNFFTISVCGKPVSKIRYFSVQSERNVHPVQEFLSGNTGQTVVVSEEYTITVKTFGVEDIFGEHPKGGIDIYCEETDEEFVNCSVKKSLLKGTGRALEREYVLFCPEVRKAG